MRIDRGSPEAHRADELARGLVTAWFEHPEKNLWLMMMQDTAGDLFQGVRVVDDGGPERLTERFTHLMAAMSNLSAILAHVAVKVEGSAWNDPKELVQQIVLTEEGGDD